MLSKRVIIRITFIISLFLILVLTLNIPTAWSATTSETPIWSLDLQHARCGSPADCEISSPALVDLTGDGILDIVLATSNGWVMAIKNNGQLLWETDVAAAFGMAANTQQINSSPAIADIDNDGYLEIVVGTGTKSQSTCTQGGVIVLDHNGHVRWRFFTQDDVIPPIGCKDTVFSTPALGDLDNDGDMEIVVGSFDKRIYVLHHNGTLDSHFPIDSIHSLRFPSWDSLRGRLADTIWSSPSLADIDGDGYLDIILGTDEGNFGPSFGPWPGNWTCPYIAPITLDYCGGALYVVDRHGNHLPGFPKHIYETIQSAPAIYDIDQDGSLEIFVGTGDFYHAFSPDHPTMGFRIYGWDNQGNDLPGWEGGKATGGSMPASPAIGDIAGDGTAEIVALSMDKKLYAWNANGSPVFTMQPVDQTGHGYKYNIGYSPILGDYDGDGKMEIFITTGWSITVIDGNGTQLTTNQNPPNKPFFFANAALQNNPVVGDIDNDGQLELITHNSTLYAWNLPNAGSKADWPMFRYNAARTGYPIQPMILAPSTIVTFHEITDTDDAFLSVPLKGIGEEAITWTANNNNSRVAFSPKGGTLVNKTAFTVIVDANSLESGTNTVSNITVTGKIDGQHVIYSPSTLSVIVYNVDQVFSVYLPIIQR